MPIEVTSFSLTGLSAILIFIAGTAAGLIGALVGVGGGILIVPLLTLGLGLDIRIAVATSLIAVVASSTAAGSVYVNKGLSNLRLGMTLEIATTLGGITGGLLAVVLSAKFVSIVFAVSMVITTVLMLRSEKKAGPETASVVSPGVPPAPAGAPIAAEIHGRLAGTYVDTRTGAIVSYEVVRIGLGSALSFIAGILSGLLGIGGGVVKVPAMNLGMKVPIQVAAATSNFMIGITAISSLFIYFSRGLVHPFIAAPVAAGVTLGAWYGTQLSGRFSATTLKRIFAAVAIVIALQIAWKAIAGGMAGVHG